MDIKKTEDKALGIKLSIEENKKEIAWTYLYILKNKLHKEPFGFLENVYVEKKYRGKGIGTKIIKEAVKEAKKNNCYKLIATSRHKKLKVHKLYEKIGFKNHGVEFRLELKKSTLLQR